jgi:hypothetical protein
MGYYSSLLNVSDLAATEEDKNMQASLPHRSANTSAIDSLTTSSATIVSRINKASFAVDNLGAEENKDENRDSEKSSKKNLISTTIGGNPSSLLDDEEKVIKNDSKESTPLIDITSSSSNSQEPTSRLGFFGSIFKQKKKRNVIIDQSLIAVTEATVNKSGRSAQQRSASVSVDTPSHSRQGYRNSILSDNDAPIDLADSKIFNEYHFAIVTQEKIRDNIRSIIDNGGRKIKYLQNEMIHDLGFKKWTTPDFWFSIVLLLVSFWLRVYVHYLGQWVYLKSARVPVYKIVPLPYKVLIKYVQGGVTVLTSVGAVVSGGFSTTLLFLVLVLITHLSQRWAGSFPVIGCRLVAFYGLASTLDPFLVLIVDLLSRHFSCETQAGCEKDLGASTCMCVSGDAFILYNRFMTSEGSGAAGVVITALIYLRLVIEESNQVCSAVYVM